MRRELLLRTLGASVVAGLIFGLVYGGGVMLLSRVPGCGATIYKAEDP